MSIDFRPDDPSISWDSPFNLNVANGNAAKILTILGLDVESEGEIDPNDLLARILMARLVDDDGEPDAVDNRGGGATMVYCGLPPGYYGMRLNALHTIAEYARELNLKVVWY